MQGSEPAFPRTGEVVNKPNETRDVPGMSTRLYVATAIMNGILSNPASTLNGNSSPNDVARFFQVTATLSLQGADALIAACKENA